MFFKQIIIIWPIVVFSLVRFITCPPHQENGKTLVNSGAKSLNAEATKVTNPKPAVIQGSPAALSSKQSAAVQPKAGSPNKFDVETKLLRTPSGRTSRTPETLSEPPPAVPQKILPVAASKSETNTLAKTLSPEKYPTASPKRKLKPLNSPTQDVPKTQLKSPENSVPTLRNNNTPSAVSLQAPKPANSSTAAASVRPSSLVEKPKSASLKNIDPKLLTSAKLSQKYPEAPAATSKRPDELPTKTTSPLKPGPSPMGAKSKAASLAETLPILPKTQSKPSETPTSVKQLINKPKETPVAPKKPTDSVTKTLVPASKKKNALSSSSHVLPRSLETPPKLPEYSSVSPNLSTTRKTSKREPSGPIDGIKNRSPSSVKTSNPSGQLVTTTKPTKSILTSRGIHDSPQQNVKKIPSSKYRQKSETEDEEYYSNGLQKQNSRISRIVRRPAEFFWKPAKTAWRFVNYLRNKATRNNGGNP